MYEFIDLLQPWLVSIAIVAALVAAGVVVHAVVFAVAGRVAAHTSGKFDELLIRRTRAPSRVLVPLLLLTIAYPWLPLPVATPAVAYHLLTIALSPRADGSSSQRSRRRPTGSCCATRSTPRTTCARARS